MVHHSDPVESRKSISSRREFLAGITGALAGLYISGCTETDRAQDEKAGSQLKPNIIIITTHDTGCHFGCYGAKGIQTPAIDQLASEGVMFTNMFSPSPMCSPSRGSLLTGRWPDNNGLLGLAGNDWHYELNNRKQHLSYVLQNQGYYTVLFGHQHESRNDSTLGFDMISSLDDENGHRSAPEITAEAADFIRNSSTQKKPFYLQVGFFETHTPYIWGDLKPDKPEHVWNPPYTQYPDDDDTLNKHIAEFQASINRVDRAVANITAALKETGLEESTLVLFTVDHGPELPRAKWTMFDAGSKIAFIMRWPQGGIQGGRTIDKFLCNVDFLPTLQEVTDVTVPHSMEGQSFAALLKNQTQKSTREVSFISFVYGLNWAVRTERYKFIRNFNGGMFNSVKFHEYSQMPITMLFDLEKDPYELNNVAEDQSYWQIREELDYKNWKKTKA